MKTFTEWLEEKHPEYNEGRIRDMLLKGATVASMAAAGAGLGVAAPHINNATANVQTAVGNTVGIENAGQVTSAKENIRKILANKVGGNAAFGGLTGAAIGAGAFLGGKKRR